MYKCLVLALPGDGVKIEPINNWRQKMLIFSVICLFFTKEEFLNSSLVDTTSRVEKATKCHF